MWYNAVEGILERASGWQWIHSAATLHHDDATTVADDLQHPQIATVSLEDCRYDLGNKTFREGVEACLRSHLTVSSDFCLDPESSQRYVNFGGLAWDRDAETFVPTEPGMLISRTTGWSHEELDNRTKELVDSALALIGAEQDEAGLNLSLIHI